MPKPLTHARALDPAYYTDPDIYAFDQSEILASGWQIIAPAALVENPGDLITREIGGVPIIVLRDNAGALQGYFNICPHRAGPLATCDQRGLKRLRCGYHGWAYDFDGRLKTAPEMQGADDFDPSQVRLSPIDVVARNGVIWARTRQGTPLEDLLSGIEPESLTQLDSLTHHHHAVYDVQANWKVYVDNYLEGYHLPFVHPGLTQVVNYPDYKTELGSWWSLQRSPIDQDSGAYGAGEALYYFIYPNTMLNILPGRLQTNRVVPVGLRHCRVEFDFFYDADNLFRFEDDLKFSDLVQEEDRQICEHVQKGLASGAYQPGRLSPTREAGVWHFQNLLREAYHKMDPIR